VAHEARQNRVPATDIPTDSHTFVNLSVARKFRIGPTEAMWFLRLDNIGNELAYNAATIRTVRELAPLPGRSVKTGLRVMF
jgi:iron complex outermembrane receptor protein